MLLSKTTIPTAKPKDKLYRLTDSSGLCVAVTPAGSKARFVGTDTETGKY